MTLPLVALAAVFLAVQSATPPPSSPAVPAVAAPAPRLYGVIFEVGTDDKGKVAKLAVSRVIDPASGTRDPVQLDVPERFIAAAKVQLLKRDYKPSDRFFTYLFFDPQRPDKGDIDPRSGQP
jgi:hypothetical protein